MDCRGENGAYREVKMNSDTFKHIYSVLLLLLTIGWAAFCVWITYRAATQLQAADVLVSAGANVLLGALINWNGNVNQFWFRKAKPTEETK